MCFSAEAQINRNYLEAKYNAIYDEISFTKYKSLSESEPKKYRSIEDNPVIFVNYYAPLITLVNGNRVIQPMRYSTYLPEKFRGTKKYSSYNARKDNLQSKFWSDSFMKNHGIIILKSFFEWVGVKDLLASNYIDIKEIENDFKYQEEKRKLKVVESGKIFKPTPSERKAVNEREIIVRFNPTQNEDMVVPVIFNLSPDEPFKGFAIVTDAPLIEILKEGHN